MTPVVTSGRGAAGLARRARRMGATRAFGAATGGVLAARRRPHHLAVAALAAGLAAGPAGPRAVLGGLALLALVVAWPGEDVRARLVVAARAVGEALEARVVLLEPVRVRAGGSRAAVVGWRGDRLLVRAPARVRWPSPGVGDVLRVAGVLERLGPRDGWLEVRHVHAVLLAGAVRATGERRGGLAGALDGVRRRAERALGAGVPAGPGGLLRGMVLGQDDALDPQLREAMRRAGLSHLTAASGQNVLLLAALVVGLSIVLGLGLRTRMALVLLLIAAYVPLAGGGPSIQRAGVMGAAGVVAVLAGRPAARWHALLLAAAVTLALNPIAWRDVGWQLSFVAVLGLLLLAPRLRDGLRRRGLPRAAAEVVAVAGAATLATAPLIALHFERTSLVALPANVLAAPLVAPAMWLGMLAAALGQVAAAPAAVPAALAAWPASAIAGLAQAAAEVPGAEAAAPAEAVLVVVAVLVAAIVRPGLRRALPAAALAGGVAAVAAAPVPARPPAGPRIAFLDIGQGDATLLQDGRHAVLVDTGPPDGDVVERMAEVGARRLDALVVTHAQADHLGAGVEVLRRLPVGLVVDGRDGVREPHGEAMAAEARRRRVPLVPARAGTVVRAGRLELRLRWPPPTPAVPGTDPNERAVVAEAAVGPARVLLAADAEGPVLTRLGLGPTDVLKVAHHGSADEALPRLLEQVRPRLAVIEVGADNRYGHPTPQALGALRAAAVPVRRTDRDGTVLVTPEPVAGGPPRLRVEARG